MLFIQDIFIEAVPGALSAITRSRSEAMCAASLRSFQELELSNRNPRPLTADLFAQEQLHQQSTVLQRTIRPTFCGPKRLNANLSGFTLLCNLLRSKTTHVEMLVPVLHRGIEPGDCLYDSMERTLLHS